MYADDIALVAESDQDLQQALTIIHDTFIQWGMEITGMKPFYTMPVANVPLKYQDTSSA